jgi:hypothetical protein
VEGIAAAEDLLDDLARLTPVSPGSLGYRLEVRAWDDPERPAGVAGQARHHERVLLVWLQPGASRGEHLRVLAHETAHALDHLFMTARSRAEFLRVRGTPHLPRWNAGSSDLSNRAGLSHWRTSGAELYAEGFAELVTGTSSSLVTGVSPAAQVELARFYLPFARPGSTANPSWFEDKRSALAFLIPVLGLLAGLAALASLT